MNNQDLRAALRHLAERMRTKAIPDVVASDRCVKDLLSTAYYSDEEEHWKEVEEEARRLLRIYYAASGSVVPPGRGVERGGLEEISIELEDATHRRGEVFSEVAVTLAEQRPDVLEFRRRLRGYPLSNEEADAFLEEGRSVRRNNLDRLATTLARFHGWRERDAARFILTGHEPVYRPVRVAVGFGESTREYVPNTARVVVTADVWADVEEVAKAYKTARRQILGGDKRKMEDRSLEVVRFVTRQTRKHGSRPPWSKLHEQWKREYPEWRYESYRGFRQTFWRSFERLVRPKYTRPKWKRSRDTS